MLRLPTRLSKFYHDSLSAIPGIYLVSDEEEVRATGDPNLLFWGTFPITEAEITGPGNGGHFEFFADGTAKIERSLDGAPVEPYRGTWWDVLVKIERTSRITFRLAERKAKAFGATTEEFFSALFSICTTDNDRGKVASLTYFDELLPEYVGERIWKTRDWVLAELQYLDRRVRYRLIPESVRRSAK